MKVVPKEYSTGDVFAKEGIMTIIEQEKTFIL